MTTALAQIQEEIAALEARLTLLRDAEKALMALANAPTEATKARMAERAKGLAGAIRSLLAEVGPKTKAEIDKALSEGKWSLGKGAVSGALQAMRVRGVVARTKAGKWMIK